MFIGIDIGGTKIRGGLLDNSFKVRQVIERPTGARRTKQVVLDTIQAVIDELNNKQVRGIGLAVRGQVDYKQGTVRESTMMPGGFENVPLARLVRSKLKKRVVIDNDVHCFTLAEAIYGAGRHKETVIGVALGTGIGGGLVVDSQIRHGAHNSASEFGHMIIQADSYKWNCGQCGCFESLCSGRALTYQYRQATGRRVDAREFERLCKQRDRAAKEILKRAARYLAIGLANLIQSIDPDVLVLGGGLSRFRIYTNLAIEQIDKHLIYKNTTKVPVRYAKLGQQAGVIGAALLLRSKN